jgi:hypothetical protein
MNAYDHLNGSRRPGTCFPSSRVLTLLYPELSYVEGQVFFTYAGREINGLSHVEGQAVLTYDGGLPLGHAWNETPDGHVIDSTLAPDAVAIFQPIRYEPHKRWTHSEILALVDAVHRAPDRVSFTPGYDPPSPGGWGLLDAGPLPTIEELS